ncbi:MAG: DNA mismatch repair endonuclease MutL [Lachnospiraceae bacterium]|jgi:DNA mismatch repair protein MutL|nr:DNA mismatch repair endonuclease MutL [Lachnospiraceae bacterium]
MGKIAVLDKQTIDKIAAGEVVERPASVVKELVENAIDANASQIMVEIRGGGIEYLRITDNGSGLEKEDIPLAFLRHSTSKIRSAQDLTGITSLGFRGEALSSISAVSMVELITKTRKEVLGNRCYLEGGVQKELEEIGAPDGTTFVVRNLFYNTPARKKFLRSEMAEASAVHEMMTHLALSHPEIAFKLMIQNQMKLQTAGSGKLKDVIYHIYGREIAMQLLPITWEKGPIAIHGFLGKPEISRGNRNYENYFVNGRYVKSKILAKGIEDGYKSYMMQHRYPFVCLDIRIDGTFLDVNVHPTKMELRFGDQNLVYDTLQQGIKEVLSKKELIPEITLQDTGVGSKAGKAKETITDKEESNVLDKKKPIEKLPLEKMWKTPEPSKEPITPEDKNLEYFLEQMRKRVKDRHRQEVQTSATPQTLREENGYQKAEQLQLFDDKLLSKKAAVRHEIIGQVFGTYWLVQYGDKLYIIDQHAAHEKVLYERLMKSLWEQNCQSQLLSPPVILNLTMPEEQLYRMYQSYFADMGFEIEEFGEQAYAVRAVPANLPGLDRTDVLIELLDSLSEISGRISSESLLDKVASMSCKAAVKGKHQMSSLEAKALIDELLTLENPYHCPHGRPTIISMTRYELEKKFKRII